MCRYLIRIVLLACAVAAFDVTAAQAQYTGGSARSLRSATRNYVYNRSTVSPYVNLASPNNSYGLSNYFTVVQPMIERQQQQGAQTRQMAQMQQQISQVQDQVRQQQQQSNSMMVTGRMGWSTRGMPRTGSYLSYYPGFQRIPHH